MDRWMDVHQPIAPQSQTNKLKHFRERDLVIHIYDTFMIHVHAMYALHAIINPHASAA